MLWVELLVALIAGGVGACSSIAIAAMVSRIDNKRRERPKTHQFPFVESVPIAAWHDDVHLAEVASMRHDRARETHRLSKSSERPLFCE